MIQSWCEINGVEEIRTLDNSMDFRDPRVRREVFFHLYEFHTALGIQPGLVYIYLPELARRLGMGMEERLWLAFLEGCTENPCTAYQVIREFPRLPRTDRELGLFLKWHAENWKKLQYDIDTRYNKGHLVEQVVSYVDALGRDTQEAWFCADGGADKKAWFDAVWSKCVRLYKFGRLTTWSYLEFVKIVSGFDYEYSSLKMTDKDGSKSHRNGLLKVLGRDDLEWWSQLDNGVTAHSRELCEELEIRGAELLEELRDRFGDSFWSNRIGNETLESTLCTFKNCFRGRRYPNIYTDMSFDRIKKAEAVAPEVDFGVFWDMRRENLPPELLLEYTPGDPGLKPEKQNYFKDTGKLPMMSCLYDCFKCSWDDKIKIPNI